MQDFHTCYNKFIICHLTMYTLNVLIKLVPKGELKKPTGLEERSPQCTSILNKKNIFLSSKEAVTMHTFFLLLLVLRQLCIANSENIIKKATILHHLWCCQCLCDSSLVCHHHHYHSAHYYQPALSSCDTL